MSLLEVRELCVEFGARRVVDRVSFSLDAGGKLALVGESGSGKTVTALSLLRLLEAARLSGEVMFGGKDVLKMSVEELHHLRGHDIAMIFQEPMTALNPVLTVGDQIIESLQIHKGLRGDAALAGAVAALERVGVADPELRVHSYPHQLSGGQRQRAMIAMALACDPKLLIADEPTTALDMTVRMQILELLDRLRTETGMALLLITHDLNLVRRFADHVAVMERGLLVEQGTHGRGDAAAAASVYAQAHRQPAAARSGSRGRRIDRGGPRCAGGLSETPAGHHRLVQERKIHRGAGRGFRACAGRNPGRDRGIRLGEDDACARRFGFGGGPRGHPDRRHAVVGRVR